MPGGRKKNVKKKENKEAPNFVEKFMENRSEAFGILHDAFIRGDLDSELGSESGKIFKIIIFYQITVRLSECDT